MHTPKRAVLADLLKQFKKKIIKESLDIPVWTSRSGVYLGGGKYEYSDKVETLHLGDSWSGYYDDSRTFSANVTVPEGFAHSRVYLNVDFGGEAMLRINGKTAGSFSSSMNNGWVHRDSLPLFDLEAGQVLELDIEAGINNAGFCDHYLAGSRSITYTLAVGRLILVDEPTEKFAILADHIFGTIDVVPDAVIRTRLYNALDDALHMIDFDFTPEVFYASVPDAFEFLKAEIKKIPYAPHGEVIMSGHSHIDAAWLWTVKETERKVERTFSNTLMLMDNYPDYRFTQSQAALYDMVKKHDPELFERIREKVKSGQWEVVGNTWVEADTNIASGESLIRQLLYGRDFFIKEFGVDSNIYWLPDCFGFTWALPQIIDRSGMKYFVTTKLANNDTQLFPHTLFRWRSHSGNEVLAYNQRTAYEGDYIPSYVKSTWDANDQIAIVNESFGMYGYGDGGSGGTTAMIEQGRLLADMPGLPAHRMGRVDEFFADVEKYADELPLYDDELYYENHRGTFTSQGFVKKNNRYGEFMLRNIELMTLLSGIEFPKEKLDELWKLLLMNQFHDIMPGTCIVQVFENCRKEYAYLASEYEKLMSSALDALCSKIKPEEDCYAVWNFDTNPQTAALAEGFTAEDVPPMGYKLYPLSALPVSPKVTVTEELLENEFLRVELDKNGEIVRIYDKKNDREVLEGIGNRLTVFQDKAVHETAWNLEANYVKRPFELITAESIRVIPDPECGIIEIVRKFNLSTITQRIVLAPKADYIDFKTEVNWQETLKMLKVAFPVTVRSREATYEIAHGTNTRPTHVNTSYDMAKFEVCGHKFADLSEGGYGVSLINDCKYGYDIRNNLMRLTLLRAPTCPDQTADKGEHSFTYRLYPHAGSWQDSRLLEYAFGLNNPMRVCRISASEGGSETEKSFISVSRKGVVLDAYKPALDGDGLILRLYEGNFSRGRCSVSLPFEINSVTECDMMERNEAELAHSGNIFEFFIKPHEVKTFRIK